jgi:hypothetical protein
MLREPEPSYVIDQDSQRAVGTAHVRREARIGGKDVLLHHFR